MKLPQILSQELGAVFQTRSIPRSDDFTAFFSLLTGAEQRTVQTLNARAFRRAVRRSRAKTNRF